MMDGNIFNGRGVHVAIVRGPAIFNLKDKKLYDLKGINIYKLSGELVGHLANSEGADKHLDKATGVAPPAIQVAHWPQRRRAVALVVVALAAQIEPINTRSKIDRSFAWAASKEVVSAKRHARWCARRRRQPRQHIQRGRIEERQRPVHRRFALRQSCP
jgi:coproporphyrinogen III oxidase